MKVSRVLETCLYATDLEAAEEFYTRVLGLEVYARVAGRHVFFRCGDAMFLVFNPDTTEKESHGHGHGCRGIGHTAWAVQASELDAWRAWFKAENVAIHEVSWPNGGHSLYFRDPAGNSLELATPAVWRMDENE